MGAVVSAVTEDWLASGSVRSSSVTVAVSLLGLFCDQKKKKKKEEKERALLSRRVSAQCKLGTKWTFRVKPLRIGHDKSCIALLHPRWNHYAIKCKWSNGHFHAYACLYARGGRESLPQLAFSCGCATAKWHRCILKKRAICSPWFIFLRLMLRCSQAKCSFHSSVCSQGWCWGGRLKKTGPSATCRNIEKLIQQTFREEYWRNVHVLGNLPPGYSIILWCNICCFEFSIFRVGMYDIMDACSVHLSEHVH